MVVAFFSDYLNHHQTPFCEAMRERLGEGFHFVATERVSEMRLKLGYKNLEDVEYVVRAYECDESYHEAMRLGYESDVVIIGDASDKFIERRLAENKLTFRYRERYFKKNRWRFHPEAWKSYYHNDIRYRKKNLHMLCASAYTAPDCRFIHAYPNKIYKWGYFPLVTQIPYEDLVKTKARNNVVRIIWVSRFIKLKHPEEIIRLARKLKNDGMRFKIEMLGIGELREQYEQIVKDERLSDVVTFTGPFPPSEVLEHMQQSDIFLFTSDKNEGWGAVMNESMSSACAPVACREIGSVPYLIEDGVNGFIYDKHSRNSLYSHVKRLMEDKDLREMIQKNAYDTMKNVWNAEVAADRLLHLINCIQKGTETGYTLGPCSRD